MIIFSSLYVSAFKNNIDSLKYAYIIEKNDSLKAVNLKKIAYEYYFKSQFDSCIFYFKKLETFAIAKKSKEALADYYEGIGIVNLAQTNYKSASDFYFKALNIREKLPNKNKLGNLLRKIGDSYSLLFQTDKALGYYRKSIDILKTQKDKSNYVVCLNNMANNYRRSKEYSLALEIYEHVLPIYDSIEPVKGRANTLEEMGICYSEMGQLQKSKKLLLKSWELTKKLNNQGTFKAHVLQYLMITLGKIPDRIGIEKFESISLAENNLIGSKAAIVDISEILVTHYNSKGDYKKALFYSNLSKEKQKIIAKENEHKIINSLGLEYNYEKEKQNSLLQKSEIKNQKYRNKILFIGIIGVSILSLIALVLYFVLRKEKVKTQEANQKLNELNENLENMVKERTKEIKAINIKLETANEELVDAIVKGQRIERKRVANSLHDNLGGNITALKYSFMAISNSSLPERELKAYNNCKELISNIYEDVRDFSHHVYPKDLEEGLETGLEIYLNRINQNTNKKFSMNFDHYQSLGLKIEFEMFSIFQELITNTIKHSNVSEISINYTLISKKHYFSYSDFPKKNVSDSGKGLSQIRERALNINAEVIFENYIAIVL